MKIKLGFIKNIALLLVFVIMQIYADDGGDDYGAPNEHFYHRTSIMPVLKAPKNDNAILEIEILSTGDIHEHNEHMATITNKINELRHSSPDKQANTKKVIVVDAGDIFCQPGNKNCGDRHLGGNGSVMAGLMSKVGYDAMIIGNHDLVYGTSRLDNYISTYNLPIYAANKVKTPRSLSTKNGHLFKYTYQNYSVTVGVIGTMCTHRQGYHLDKSSSEKKSNLAMKQVTTENVKKWVSEFQPKPDIIVLLTHQDDNLDENITGVDVLIGGHSHNKIDKFINGKMLVKAGAFGKYLGVTKIFWDLKNHKRKGYIESEMLNM
ncbi:MAG: hypothetical protein A2X78_01800 [Gammaproteobacteria bacterium GWE2_37_16]|nr:MAG: hypothetical protein A2X78_01800 [Gammaproteobacteria bacterium GWE2_37_16]